MILTVTLSESEGSQEMKDAIPRQARNDERNPKSSNIHCVNEVINKQ